MNRRSFIAAGGAITVAALAGLNNKATAQDTNSQPSSEAPAGKPFNLLFAPHFGMFAAHAGKDIFDQLQFMADQGFRALEDNGLKGRSVQDQERLGKELQRLGMTMGVFVAHGNFGIKSFVLNNQETRDMLKKDMQDSLEVAKRVNAKWCTVVLDQFDPAVEEGFQMANAIDNLRMCAEILEPAGLTMVLEPLNRHNHPGLFLTKIPQAYAICRAVNSPACKILNDLYHQQIQEGNLIPNLDAAWSEIAYFQVGDNPGRKEPGTGEINYKKIFRHLKEKNYQGVVGMEHGNAGKGKEGELALLAAYREVDPA